MAEFINRIVNADTNILFASLAGGIVPALFWLWFWLREDKLNPEPRALLIRTFFAGALVTIFVLPLELLAQTFVLDTIQLIIVWALIEEAFKLRAARGALKSASFDEPVDGMIYLITAALGFSATENVLFLIRAFVQSGPLAGILLANVRFVGATLAHILSSGIIGASLGFTLGKSTAKRTLYLATGLFLGTALHAYFNFRIIKMTDSTSVSAFPFVWFAIIGLLLVFERIKKQKSTTPNAKA